jgi:hypothetical protein
MDIDAERPGEIPDIGHAKKRCMVQLPDGTVGRLSWVRAESGMAKVRVEGRHVMVHRGLLRVLDDQTSDDTAGTVDTRQTV